MKKNQNHNNKLKKSNLDFLKQLAKLVNRNLKKLKFKKWKKKSKKLKLQKKNLKFQLQKANNLKKLIQKMKVKTQKLLNNKELIFQSYFKISRTILLQQILKTKNLKSLSA